MTGVVHHAPGLAVAALTDDAVFAELIADGHHVHPPLWPIITRTKPPGRLLLVSDALAIAGMGDGRTSIGGMEVEVVGSRATLAGTDTLAGSVIALDTAVRNLVRAGSPLPAAVAAAGANPLALLGVADRGRIEVGQLRRPRRARRRPAGPPRRAGRGVVRRRLARTAASAGPLGRDTAPRRDGSTSAQANGRSRILLDLPPPIARRHARAWVLSVDGTRSSSCHGRSATD